MLSQKTVDALLGLCLGDALGVPFEFSSQDKLKLNPATTMIGYGTWNQAPGTWSDDSSLALCLADSLTKGFSLEDQAIQFIQWKEKAHWAARGEVFDIGHTTYTSISRLKKILQEGRQGELPKLRLSATEQDNGNGSLMRIIPLVFHIKGMPIEEQFEITWQVSALTHRHIRAAMACQIYLSFAEELLNGIEKFQAYQNMQAKIKALWSQIDFPALERQHFKRLIEEDIWNAPYETIFSGGYVMESIEASLYCFMTQNTYTDTVFAAINLGHDTDTTAAIVGGIAGIHYGMEAMPMEWLKQLARFEEIVELGKQLAELNNT